MADSSMPQLWETAVFPIASAQRRRLPDRLVGRLPAVPAWCNVCGRASILRRKGHNYRETLRCLKCGAINRHRQVAHVVTQGINPRYQSLSKLALELPLAVYNTESKGAIHETLMAMAGYTCSEFFSPDAEPGSLVNGVMHQDLMRLSFRDGSFDLVISGEVFEHIPEPYRAHAELHRVLRPGGRHVFSVPFYADHFRDEVRAVPDSSGRPEFLMDPIYHDDPVNPVPGALVYTIFSIEMLTKLDAIGFHTNLYHLYNPRLGIFGSNAFIFEAIKR